MAELFLNGVLEEETGKYYHVCCFTDKEGHDPENADNYVFIPQAVSRIVDDYTISVLDFYVYKKKLQKYVRAGGRAMLKRIQKKDEQTQQQQPPSTWQQRKPIGVFKAKKIR